MTVTGAWRRAAHGAMLLGDDGEVRPTIFAEMSGLAVRHGAINLGQGFPDEDGPAEVLEAAQRAIRDGHNQYAPAMGVPVLREAIADHRERFWGLSADPDREVLVTAGATEALTATLLALLEPGDEVVTFEPFYDLYAAVVALAGATLRPIPLLAPEFEPDLDRLRDSFTDRTRIVLVNNPHNPTGAMLSKEALQLIAELAERHDAVIVADEVYEHLGFESKHTPIATIAGAAERTVSISSAAKTFNVTGWKIGWLVASPALVEAIVAVKQWLTYVNGTPFQHGVAVGLGLPDEFFSGVASSLAHKRNVLSAGLREAGFSVSPSEGGYFVVADATPLGYSDAATLCRELPERAGVAAIPLSAFVTPENRAPYESLVRFAFCKRIDVLESAAARLASMG